LTNYVNGIAYPENYIFEIEKIYNDQAYTSGFVHSMYTGRLKFNDLEHGMKLKGGEFIKKINVDTSSNKESFYFLHIAKTSGISFQSELKKAFANEQNFINSLQYINEDDMLNSKLISGHFAMHPFVLYKNNNKKLNGLTIIRNPIDRAISFFTFRYKTIRSVFGLETKKLTNENFDNFLQEEQNLNFISNYQTKTITSDLNTNDCSLWVNKYMNNEITRIDISTALVFNSSFMNLKNNESLWKESLDNFNIIGTVDKRELFLDKTSILLKKNNYNAKLTNVVKNKSDFSNEEIKKILTKDQINKIIELNQYDFEFYDFIMSKGGVLEF
jgi:hypothetical protein